MCSSAVTTQEVLDTDFRIAAASKGFMVCILINSTEIPCSLKILAASIDFQTKCPQAMIVTSFPS